MVSGRFNGMSGIFNLGPQAKKLRILFLRVAAAVWQTAFIQSLIEYYLPARLPKTAERILTDLPVTQSVYPKIPLYAGLGNRTEVFLKYKFFNPETQFHQLPGRLPEGEIVVIGSAVLADIY